MDAHYENRYVALLDILGFKEMIARSGNDQQLLNTIDRALNYTSYLQRENYESALAMVDLGKEVSVYSDSIVISYNQKGPGYAFHILMDLVHICLDLISTGLFVRGGVTVGYLIHDNTKYYGPAYMEAYNLESQYAIYPRIIIDPKVIKSAIENKPEGHTDKEEWDFINELILEDKDGLFYLDYLSQFQELDEPYMYYNLLESTKTLIVNNLKQHQNNERVLDKYIWFKNYFNDTVKKFKGCECFLID